MRRINKMMMGVFLATLFACNGNSEDDMNKVHGIDTANMDLNVEATQDFYNYANGGWMKTATIPDDESRWGSFMELRDVNDKMTLELVDKALANKNIDKASDEGKVVTFFNMAMDTDRLNEMGTEPIQPMLAKIDAINSKQDLLNYMVETAPYLSGLFGASPYADLKNSNMTALYLGTGTLGLPERDYYVGEDDDSKDKRKKYVAHVARMFGFLGKNNEDAAAVADDVMAFETKMAESMLTKEESRNPMLMYNPKSIAEIGKITPSVDWTKYFSGIGAGQPEQVIVTQPKYMERVQELMDKEDLGTIKNYLRWVLLNDAASYMSEEIADANFDFYGKALRDLKKQKPRNERVLSTTNGVLGEALGKLYVAEYFPAEAKETAVEMVENIRRAYENRINNLDWMSDSTKVMAKTKLNGMMVKIGYPDTWKDYSDLEVSDAEANGTFYGNMLNARKWNHKKDMAKIGKPVDKTEWMMSPQTVNAYYNPLYNEIVFPAAILQPPFFDFKADAAVNYGGIGAVIGHEISHGFDDQGSRFDADGNMNNWWTESDAANFKERGEQLIAQYDAYEPLEGINVNGEFTLGENIGDLGGLNAAYDGLQLHLSENGNPGEIDGLTPEQRLFVNWATVWRTKIRDEALINQIKTDPHSPGIYRAVGPVENIDGFYTAFDVKEGDEMFKAEEDRVRIW